MRVVTHRDSLSDQRRSLLLSAALSCPLLLLPTAPTLAYVDDAARFSLTPPPGFVVLRRTAATGTIFVSGDFPRGAVLSVTAWPLAALLENDARALTLPGLPAPSPVPVPAQPPARLSDVVTEANAMAQLLMRARDRETTSGELSSRLLSAEFTDRGAALKFSFDTDLSVVDSDALEKERGVRRLLRRTSAVSTMAGGAGSEPEAGPAAVMTVWGSALAQDWDADLGEPMEDAVASFKRTGSSSSLLMLETINER
jgi:hypothetical protein